MHHMTPVAAMAPSAVRCNEMRGQRRGYWRRFANTQGASSSAIESIFASEHCVLEERGLHVRHGAKARGGDRRHRCARHGGGRCLSRSGRHLPRPQPSPRQNQRLSPSGTPEDACHGEHRSHRRGERRVILRCVAGLVRFDPSGRRLHDVAADRHQQGRSVAHGGRQSDDVFSGVAATPLAASAHGQARTAEGS